MLQIGCCARRVSVVKTEKELIEIAMPIEEFLKFGYREIKPRP
jgi:hypothetical protein